jgi:hypothetical protein
LPGRVASRGAGALFRPSASGLPGGTIANSGRGRCGCLTFVRDRMDVLPLGQRLVRLLHPRPKRHLGRVGRYQGIAADADQIGAAGFEQGLGDVHLFVRERGDARVIHARGDVNQGPHLIILAGRPGPLPSFLLVGSPIFWFSQVRAVHPSTGRPRSTLGVMVRSCH